jgi:ATP-dependent DNA helicase RecG
LTLSRDQRAVLRLAATPQPMHSLMVHCGKANRSKFRDRVVRPLLEAGLLTMTVPEKPRSSKQQYRTTKAGATVLTDSPSE